MKKIVFFLFLVIVLAGGIFFVNLSGFNNTAEAEEWTYIYIKSDAVPEHPYTVSIGGTDTHFDTIEAALNYAHDEFLYTTSSMIVFDNAVISPPETGVILPNAVYSGEVRFEGSSTVGFIIEDTDNNSSSIDAKFQNLTITTYVNMTAILVRNVGFLYATDLYINIGNYDYSVVNDSVYIEVEQDSTFEYTRGYIIITGDGNCMNVFGSVFINNIAIDVSGVNNTIFFVEEGYLDISNSAIYIRDNGNVILNNQFNGCACFSNNELMNYSDCSDNTAFLNGPEAFLEVYGGYINIGYALYNEGEALIFDCEVWRQGGASQDYLIYNSGVLDIMGGTYCNGYGNTILSDSGGTLRIYEDDGVGHPTSVSGKTSAVKCENSGIMYFYGGTIEMTETAAVGVIVDDGDFYGVSGQIISKYECINIGENGYVRLGGDCYIQAKGTGSRAINVSGYLEVIGQAEIVTTGGTGILVNADGNLKIEAEPEESEYTVNAIGEDEDGSICIDNRGFADIRSGRLTTGNKGILNTGDGELYIYNIDIESTSDFGGNAGAEGDYVLKNESYAEIYGGYFYASRAGIPCVKNYGNLSIVEDEETLSISAVSVGIYNASTAAGPADLIFDGGSIFASGDAADSAAILNESSLDISGGYINHSGQYGICIKNIDSPFGDPGTVSISGGSTIACSKEGDYEAESYTIVNEATSDYDFVSASGRGYIRIWDGIIINDSPEGVAIWTKSGALTFIEGSETRISAVQNTAVLNEGEFMLYGGEIEADRYAIENLDTLRIYGGTVYAFLCAIMNSGLCNIKGGTVQSDICAIDNYEEMYIFGSEATVRIIGEEDDSVAIANSGYLISISSGTVINEGTGINRRTIVNYDGAIVQISESGEVRILNDDIDNTSYCVLNEAGGEFRAEGGTLSATGAYTPLIINQKSDTKSGRVIINNGIIAPNITAECYLIYNSGDVTILAGTFTCDTPGQIAIINLGVMTVNGGTFEAIQSCISNTGELEIQNGSISAVDNAIHTSGSSSLTISGGTFATSGDNSSVIIADQYSENSVNITGGAYSSTGSTYTIINNLGAGTINIMCAIDISNFDSIADKVIVNQAGVINLENNIKTKDGICIMNYSGTVNLDTEGITIDCIQGGTAISNLDATGTINILKSCTINSNTNEMIHNTGIVDINAGTFNSSSGRMIYNVGTGQVYINGGTFNSSSGRIIYNVGTGRVYINGGTLDSTATNEAIINTATIFINNSPVIRSKGVAITSSGTIEIDGGSITGDDYAVYLSESAALTINSGTFSTSADGSSVIFAAESFTGSAIIDDGSFSSTGSNHSIFNMQGTGTVSLIYAQVVSQGEGDSKAINVSAGTFDLSGGNITSLGINGKGANISGGVFNMSGGTIDAQGEGDSIGINVTGGSFNMMEGEVISRGNGAGSYVICGGDSASISLNQDEYPITLTGNRPIYVNSGSKTLLSGITIVSGEYAVKCVGSGGIDMLNCEFDMDQNTVLTYAVICSGEATLNVCAIFSDKGGIYSDGRLFLSNVMIDADEVGVELQGNNIFRMTETGIYSGYCGIYANTSGQITIGDVEAPIMSTISVSGHTSDLADIEAGIGGRALLNLKSNEVIIRYTQISITVNEQDSEGAGIDMRTGKLFFTESSEIYAYAAASGATVTGIYLTGSTVMSFSTDTLKNDGTIIVSEGVGITVAGSRFDVWSGKINSVGSCFVIHGSAQNQIWGGQFTTTGQDSACAQIISGILLVAQNSGAVFSNNSETATILSGTNSTIAFYSGEFRNAGSDLILELASGRTEESVNQLISPDVHLYLNISVDKYLVLGKYDSDIDKYVLNSSTKAECKIEARINDKYTFKRWVDKDGGQIGTDPTVTIGNNVYFKVKSVIKVSFSLLPTASAITYGDTLDTSMLSFWGVDDALNSKPVPGNVAFVLADEILPAGQHIVEVCFTPDDEDTYDTAICEAGITINRRQITVTALDKTKTYGDEDPELDYTVDQLVGGDTLNGVLIRDAGEAVGEYDILNDGITDEENPDYIITFVPGTLTVETRPLYVYYKDNSILYGDGDPEIELDHIENYAFEDDLDPENPAGKREPGVSVGVYIYSAEGAPVNTNYHFAVPAEGGALTINKRPLMITLTDCAKDYGDPDPELGYTLQEYEEGVGGWVEGDTFNPSTITRSPGEFFGSYIIDCSYNNQSYIITVDTAILTINKKNLVITASDVTAEYGDFSYSLNYTITGLAPWDTQSVIGEVWIGRDIGDDVGEYNIRVGCQQLSDNYTYQNVFGILTITPRLLKVTANAAESVYGDPEDPVFTYVADRLVLGDALSGALTREDITNRSAGNYQITIGTLANSNYTITEFVPATYTIKRKDLIVTFADKSRYYGESDPDYEIISVTGYLFSDGDNPEAYPSAEREPGNQEGAYKYYPVGEPVNPNYCFAAAPDTGYLNIVKRPLKISLASYSKTYGDPDPTFEYELHDVDGVGGWVEGDIFDTTQISRVSGEAVGEYDINCYYINPNYDITLEKGKLTITKKQLTISAVDKIMVYGELWDPQLTCEITGFAFDDKFYDIGTIILSRTTGRDVGDYTITVSSSELSTNYTYTYVNAVFTILPRPITISAYDAGKTYGDADPASFDYTITAGNLAKNDTLSGSLMREPGDDAGGYRIYTETLNNANNPNYDITFNEGTFTIDKRALTLIINNKSKLYGDPDPAPAYEISGYLEDDEPQEQDELEITRTVGETVGTYQYSTESNPSNGNYRFQLSVDSGALTINPRPLTITLTDVSKIYGDADPDFGYQLQAYETGVGGWVSGDVFDPSEIWKEDGEDVGEHDIDCGYQNGNYIITVIKGKLTITERQLTITAKDGAKVYGSSDPVLEYEITGLAFLDNGETIGGVTVSREPGENAGTYAIVVSSAEASSNYTYTYNQGVFTINPKPVTAAVDNAAKVYGDSDPDGFTYSVEGLVGDDTLTGNLSREPGENAGSYVITGVLSNDNYDVTMIDGAFTITKRPINVAAENKSKYYGAEDPELTFTHDDLVGNDEITGNLARLVGENVGKYAITIGTVTAGDNYEINFTAGELTILNNVGCDITSLKVNQADAEIDGLNITASTLHTVTYGGITLGTSPYSTFKVYSDSACTEEVSKDGLSLNLGANTVYIKVTAQDGATNKVYTLTVTRVPSNDSALSPAKDGIAADNNTFTITKYKGKTFDFSGNFAVPETAAYKIYTDPDFTNEFAGDSLTLKNGKNTYYIRVTAQDNTTSDYVLTIEKVSNTWVYILLGSVFGTAGIAVGTILLLKKFKIIPKQQKPKQQPKPKQK